MTRPTFHASLSGEMSPPATLTLGFEDAQRLAVADLYWQAFRDKLSLALGPRQRAVRFLADILDPRFAIVATGEDGRLMGVAGFRTTEGALIGGALCDITAHYGRFGALWRSAVLSVMERAPVEGLLQMDGIAVAPWARGVGLGSRLMQALAGEARSRALTAIQLDVVDANTRARALYERLGFRAVGAQHAGIFAPLIGFRSATTMRWTLG
ncbi:MAG: GNAT family N-acetyltransferase [Pseudomonadota bacterium]